MGSRFWATLLLAVACMEISSTAKYLPNAEKGGMFTKGFPPGFVYNCSGKDDGNYPHPTKCTHYVACVGKAYAYEMICAMNHDGTPLHYVADSGPEPVKSRCDYPEIAKCTIQGGGGFNGTGGGSGGGSGGGGGVSGGGSGGSSGSVAGSGGGVSGGGAGGGSVSGSGGGVSGGGPGGSSGSGGGSGGGVSGGGGGGGGSGGGSGSGSSGSGGGGAGGSSAGGSGGGSSSSTGTGSGSGSSGSGGSGAGGGAGGSSGGGSGGGGSSSAVTTTTKAPLVVATTTTTTTQAAGAVTTRAPTRATTKSPSSAGKPGDIPFDTSDCTADDKCKIKGACRKYYTHNKELKKWEEHDCGQDLFWNEKASTGSIHGGNCDFFLNLEPDVQEKYRNDPECIPPCEWWQTEEQECSGKYNYRVPFNNVTLLGRESILDCPRSSGGESLIWVASSLACERCADATDSKGNKCRKC